MYSIAYKRNFGPEQLKEIYAMIEKHHFAFITSEGERKTESLRLLKGYTVEFLSKVSHSSKFKFKETESILQQSVYKIPGFNAREASIAFENFACYPHNLLEQPWRTEFHKLKMSSGFFIHNISLNLFNSQELLILMGYVSTNDYTLQLSKMADQSVLLAVSRDCYVASQECLILAQIQERTLSELGGDYGLPIREVYEARRTYMGDTDTIVSQLVLELRQRKRQESISKRSSKLESEFSNQYIQSINQNSFVPIDRHSDVIDNGNVSSTSKSYVGIESVNTKEASSRKNGYRPRISCPVGSISAFPGVDRNISGISSSSTARRSTSSTTSSSSPRSPSSCGSLKEIQELFLQTYLEQNGGGTTVQPSVHEQPKHQQTQKKDVRNSEIEELVSQHRQRVAEVAASKQMNKYTSRSSAGNRRSLGANAVTNADVESFQYNYSHTNSVQDDEENRETIVPLTQQIQPAITKSSAFKGLKHHQDLPKTHHQQHHTYPTSNGTTSLVHSSGNGATNGNMFDKIRNMTLKSSKFRNDQVSSDISGGTPSGKNRALTFSKVSSDYDTDKIDMKGSGILDRQGIKSPSLNFSENLIPISNGTPNTRSPVDQISQSWSCPHCTYINVTNDSIICEICSKSRDFTLNEA